jgi:hypothetical protein
VQARDVKSRMCDLPRHFVRAMFCTCEDQNGIGIICLSNNNNAISGGKQRIQCM